MPDFLTFAMTGFLAIVFATGTIVRTKQPVKDIYIGVFLLWSSF
jgi:hypothetical protein